MNILKTISQSRYLRIPIDKLVRTLLLQQRHFTLFSSQLDRHLTISVLAANFADIQRDGIASDLSQHRSSFNDGNFPFRRRLSQVKGIDRENLQRPSPKPVVNVRIYNYS